MLITICIDPLSDAIEKDPDGAVKAMLEKVSRFTLDHLSLFADGEYKFADDNGNVYATFHITHYI